jgi:hypothetical protein
MDATTLELRPGSVTSAGPPDGLLGRVFRAIAAIPSPPVEGLFAPVDRLRSRFLRAVAPHCRSLVVRRDRRVALVASALLCSALLFSSLVPLWLIAVGPILWGIPHIVSDVRYLVARPGYHRRPALVLTVGAGILGAGLGYGLRAGLLGAAGALLCARASWRRRAMGLGVIGLLLGAAVWAGGYRSDLFFAHAHNAVAFGLWWAWRRRESRLHWLPLVLFAAGATLILGGVADPIVARAGGMSAPWTGLTARWVASALSPTPYGVGPLAARLLVLYAFGQSAHYVVWMRLVPEDDRPSPAPRSFQQSFRALGSDVGGAVLWTALLGMIALGLWATVNVGAARNGYIQLAFFHGYLELAAAALLWAEARGAEPGVSPG